MAAVAGCGSLRAGGRAAGSTAKRDCTRASPKRRALARWPSTVAGLCRASNVCAPDPAVVAGFLDLEHVRRLAESRSRATWAGCPEGVHAEVVAIVNGGFGTQARTAPARLVILLEVRVFVIDVQRRDDPLGNYARPASGPPATVDLRILRAKISCTVSGRLKSYVLPDDFLEKLPPCRG